MLDIKVLHSEAHSTGKSHSDLLVVNGNEIGSSDQANGACKLDLSPVLNLLCLTASGGDGKNGLTEAAADVATFDVGGGSLTGTVSGSSSSGGAAGTPELPTPSQAAHRGGTHQSAARPPAATPSQAALPFTGADTQRSALVALAMTMIGATATLFGRRRRFV
jgi:LPXTG-motif cell wall-anchored protein